MRPDWKKELDLMIEEYFKWQEQREIQKEIPKKDVAYKVKKLGKHPLDIA